MIEEQKQLLEHSKMEYNKKLQVLLHVFLLINFLTFCFEAVYTLM